MVDLISADTHVLPAKTDSVETYHALEEPHVEDYISLKSFTSNVISVGPEEPEDEDSIEEAIIAEIISSGSIGSDGTATYIDSVEIGDSTDQSIISHVISVDSSSGTISGLDSEVDDLSIVGSSIGDEISASSYSSGSTPLGSVVTETDESLEGSSPASYTGSRNDSSESEEPGSDHEHGDQPSDSAAQNDAASDDKSAGSK